MNEENQTIPGGAEGEDDKNASGGSETLESLRNNRDKILSEKKEWQRKARESETKLAEYHAKLADLEAKDAEGKGDLKRLLDLERERRSALENELKDSHTKLSSMAEEQRDRKKLASVLQAFDGGLDKRWWGIIDVDKVIIDENGDVDQHSLEKHVKTLKETFPEMVKTRIPGMPKNISPTSGQTISYDMWKTLSHGEQNKWKNSQIV